MMILQGFHKVSMKVKGSGLRVYGIGGAVQ